MTLLKVWLSIAVASYHALVRFQKHYPAVKPVKDFGSPGQSDISFIVLSQGILRLV